VSTTGEPPLRAELRIHTICLSILTVVAVGLTLLWLRAVMIPFVVAVFLAIAFMPLVDILEIRAHLSRTVASCVVLLLACLVLAGLLALTSTAVYQMGSTATQYQKTIEKFIDDASKWKSIQWLGLKPPDGLVDSDAPGAKAADKSAAAEPNTLVPDDNLPLETIKQQKTFVNPLSLIPGSTVQTLLIGVTSAVVGVLQQSVLVLVFLFFLLLSSVKRDHPIGGAWGVMEGRIRGYIVTMTALSGITGFLVGTVLWLFGVQAPVLFGMLTFLFNFIPNVGSFISIVLTIPAVWLSLGLSNSEKWMAVLIPAAIQFFIGTFIQPKMMGESMKLHPVVIVISLIFWGMLWGIVGAFLAVPITSVIRIACDRHPLTKPVADLMAGQLGALREEPIVVPTSDLVS
jgi:AI-2 transport protein TqsA